MEEMLRGLYDSHILFSFFFFYLLIQQIPAPLHVQDYLFG